MAELENLTRTDSVRARLEGVQLAALSNAIVGLHRRYYGRGATRARCYQPHDDLVLVEMRDAYITVEHTLLARGQEDAVRSARLTFQQAMSAEFIGAVEEITHRKVQAYRSESFASPEVVLEIFYLEPSSAVQARLERERAEDAGEIDRPTGGNPDAD
jgi:uncharacterized protein YbcI